MANRKISDLTALTTPATGDLLPIVDISEAAAADKNKKITFGELFASILAGTAAAPSVAFEGDSDTGIYSPGANQVAISTNGISRIVVDGSGNVNIDSDTFYVDAVNNRVGIGGLTSPDELLSLNNGNIKISGNTADKIWFSGDGIKYLSNTGDASTSILALRGRAGLIFNTGGDTTYNGGTERARIDSSGRLLVGGSPDSGGALLQVFGDRIRIGTAKTPASATATGTTGEIAWDANYIYVCTATNTWKRMAIATW
jgi:hypothetical protein